MANRILKSLFGEVGKGGETSSLVEPQTNPSPLMRSVTLLRRSCAGLADLTLLLCGEATQVQAGACQSSEAVFNLEAGMRDGLIRKQAKAIILKDGYSDGSAAFFSYQG